MRQLIWCSLVAFGAGIASAADTTVSEDATVAYEGGKLRMSNAVVRLDFALEDGLRRISWFDPRSDRELLRRPVPDFTLQVDGSTWTSDDRAWDVAEPVSTLLQHGEIETRVTLTRDGIEVERVYVFHPGISLVRGYLNVRNRGGARRRIETPPIAQLATDLNRTSLFWMSGAECFGDSWLMREEPLAGEGRAFDSYDAPPESPQPSGDGTDLRILLNGDVVWPEEGWAHSRHSGDVQSHDLELSVRKDDRIEFVVGRHEQMSCDTTAWDPSVRYGSDEVFTASAGFAQDQGGNHWRYEYLGDDGSREEMVYDGAKGNYGERWRRKVGVIEPFLSGSDAHPDPWGAVVRVFVAPRDGKVQVTGAARNSGNAGPAGQGFRLGSQTYAPWFALRGGDGQTVYMGFDCMGHWHAEFRQATEGATADLHVAGYARALGPGEALRTPTALFGICGYDFDDMGQEILDWQYRCMWDYTREPWFPAVRMLGYWMKGTNWGAAGWIGGEPDWKSAYRKIFRTAAFMRQVGGDTYHRDWGWWDRAGDWNGPDFRSANEYLAKHEMGLLIYAFLYTVDGESSVAKAHPDWLANPNTLDQSMPVVVDYELEVLDRFRQQWGPYQWRNDSGPLAPRDGDDTVLLAQEQGFMEVLRRFLEAHPDCAFQGVNGGGMALNWEYLKYGSGFQFTDGQSRDVSNYYASYLFPPDKINDMPDSWDPDRYDPATWRRLLCSNIDMTGDTFDEAKLEGLRLLLDIYHYLQDRGVVGRWVRVYHPRIEGDIETMYLQRMNWDRTRGILITKHRIEGSVDIRPKGLLADTEYEVSFQEDGRVFTRTGANLMEEGLTLESPAPGELIYLNLTDHPGNRRDTTPPTAPSAARAARSRNMGVPGVEVSWQPASDETWLSHYTVSRDGQALERVAKGCFYFDHSAGADPAAIYEIRAVDGSGNVSLPAATQAGPGPRIEVLDDRNPRVAMEGDWLGEELAPAHGGTLRVAGKAGAAFELEFKGRAVTWHSRLGAAGGQARIRIDGMDAGKVSCYAADEIPAWPIFEHQWDEPGPHTIRIEVLGESDARNGDTRVWLDALGVCP